MNTRCRHSRAFPWMSAQWGIMWCPDCGAIRQIASSKPGGFYFSTNHWIYPRGHEDVCKQLDRTKMKEE